MKTNSPQITKLSWGKIEIGGKQEFKDVKLFSAVTGNGIGMKQVHDIHPEFNIPMFKN